MITKEAILQDAVAATATGAWISVESWRRITVHVTGTFVANVQLFGCCLDAKPLDATDHVQLGSTITVPTIYEITAKLKWLKAKVTWTSGTSVTVIAIGDPVNY